MKSDVLLSLVGANYSSLRWLFLYLFNIYIANSNISVRESIVGMVARTNPYAPSPYKQS